MSITVSNTQPDTPSVTLFGRMNDGTYRAKVMNETDVPYSLYWENSREQVMVYIHPNEDQLQAIVTALNEERLDYSSLQDFGDASGGTSIIPV